MKIEKENEKMSKYITRVKEEHYFNNTVENEEKFFDDYAQGLSYYCEKQKKFNQIKRVLNNGVNKIEYEDNVDPFDETNIISYIRGWVEVQSGEYNAKTEMHYSLTLEQIKKQDLCYQDK